MAKTALVAGEPANGPQQNPLVARTTQTYEKALTFFNDVRAEMRKVVTPSRKEVQATTTVVLVTVFIFGLYFWIIDSAFVFGLTKLMNKLTGQ
jgi:preprotein translocase subunit SecE